MTSKLESKIAKVRRDTLFLAYSANFTIITFVFVSQKKGWLSSRVGSVLDSGTEGPGSNRSRDAVG